MLTASKQQAVPEGLNVGGPGFSPGWEGRVMDRADSNTIKEMHTITLRPPERTGGEGTRRIQCDTQFKLEDNVFEARPEPVHLLKKDVVAR